MASLGRKRMRSDECSFMGQSKQFINQLLVDKNNSDTMKQIHSKRAYEILKSITYNHDNNFRTQTKPLIYCSREHQTTFILIIIITMTKILHTKIV